MNQELEKTLDKITPVLDMLAEAVCIFDRTGELVYENSAYKEMTQRANTEMVADSTNIIVENVTIGKITIYHDMSEIYRLHRELDIVKQGLRRVDMRYTFDDVVGCSSAFASVKQTAMTAASTPASILLEGEIGVGKAVFAQAIHNASKRRTQGFVKVDCAASPMDLFDHDIAGRSSAYGHPYYGPRGPIEDANRGTLYLANVDRLTLEAQQKLLALMVSREIFPLGAYGGKKVDVRYLASTKTDLGAAVLAGSFSRELYERLKVFHLRIPPLRSRASDIEMIARYFINQYNFILNRRIKDIEKAAVELLMAHDWPYNVRELENVLSKTIVGMDDNDELIRKIHVLNLLEKTSPQPDAISRQAPSGNIVVKLSDAVKETERAHIMNALERNSGDKNKAAADLDIPLRTLYYKCNKLDIS